MPKPPKKGEKQNDFIARCIKELTEANEYKDQQQRVAVCYSTWEQAKKKKEDDFPVTRIGNNANIAGSYEELPELPEGFKKPKSTLEIMEEELRGEELKIP